MGEKKDEIIKEALEKLKAIAGDLSKKLDQQIKLEINTNPHMESVKINFTQINL